MSSPRGTDSPGCYKCKSPGYSHAHFCACDCHVDLDPVVIGEPELGTRQFGPWGPGFSVKYDDGVLSYIDREIWTLESWRRLCAR